ncbi:hypothetical protein ZWY2020_051099 [Hordeum vulgare]|nr:hypothetical protein ZWY2020_051099 [Hordeum vulgare]
MQHLFWDFLLIGKNLTKRAREKDAHGGAPVDGLVRHGGPRQRHIAARLALGLGLCAPPSGTASPASSYDRRLCSSHMPAGSSCNGASRSCSSAVFPLVDSHRAADVREGFSVTLEGAPGDADCRGGGGQRAHCGGAFSSEDKIRARLFEAQPAGRSGACFWKGQIAGIAPRTASPATRPSHLRQVLANYSAKRVPPRRWLRAGLHQGQAGRHSVFQTIDLGQIEPTTWTPQPSEAAQGRRGLGVDFCTRRGRTFRSSGTEPPRRASRTLALVGNRAGATRAPILALIQRFYGANSGRVLLDGKDIR